MQHAGAAGNVYKGKRAPDAKKVNHAINWRFFCEKKPEVTTVVQTFVLLSRSHSKTITVTKIPNHRNCTV